MASASAHGKITVNLKGIRGIEKALKSKNYVKIGIFGKNNAAHDEDSGLTNAELGLIHLTGTKKKPKTVTEHIKFFFGSATQQIPARNWLDGPLKTKKSQLNNSIKKHRVSISNDLASGKMDVLFDKIGLIALGVIQKAFASNGYGQWAPNAASTVAKKGSSKPLNDTGEFKRSIDYEVVDNG